MTSSLTDKIMNTGSARVSRAIDKFLRPGIKVKTLYKQYAPDTTVWGCSFTRTMLYDQDLTIKSIVRDYGFTSKSVRGKRFTVNEDPEMNYYTLALMDTRYVLNNNPELAREVAAFLNITTD